MKANFDTNRADTQLFFDKVSNGGRPRRILTQAGIDLIEDLSSIMCTEEEIAQIMSCGRDLFYTEDNREVYRHAVEKGQSNAKQSVRRLQFNKAKEGNVTMLIWLGKQYLGQREKIDTNLSQDDSAKLMKEFLEDIKSGKETN